jgi:hypothetical protein
VLPLVQPSVSVRKVVRHGELRLLAHTQGAHRRVDALADVVLADNALDGLVASRSKEGGKMRVRIAEMEEGGGCELQRRR